MKKRAGARSRRSLMRVPALIVPTTFSLLLLGASFGARDVGGAQDAPKSAENTSYLRGAGAEWDSLFDARDATNLAALYSEDVISMPFNAPTMHGRKALQADFEAFFTKYTGRHETLVDEILAHDGWAIERARYVLTFRPKAGGAEIRESGRHVVCRKRTNNRWQIAWELWNTDTPAQK